MSRNKGSFNFASNFEVLTKAPLDARLVVATKADLIDPSIWKDTNSNIWLYKGIVVSVTSDTSTENNGLYFLTDENNYTNYSYWSKITSGGSIDASGTPASIFQLNNDSNGVILKDVSGNLQVVTFDGSTYANIQSGALSVSSLKVDSLNGILYAVDGSIYANSSGFVLKAYDGSLFGNGITSDFTVDHSLNTLRQNINIYDNYNKIVYPELERGLNSDVISFGSPIPNGVDYEIIIIGF